MLKRVLALGVLSALVFMLTVNAAPPVEASTPEAAIPETGEVSGVDPDTGVGYIIWWFPALDTPGDQPVAEAGDPRPDFAQETIDNLPQDVLDRIPESIKVGWGAGGGATAFGNQQNNCEMHIAPPEETSGDLYADTYLTCSGPDISKTRLTVRLQRQLNTSAWTTLDTNDGGWLSVNSQSRSVDGNCTTGTHKYRNRSTGQVKLTNGHVSGRTSNRTATLTC